jgi:parallel beta-helix repeat protein
MKTLLILLALACSALNAAEIFVATAGDDNDKGTEKSPLATLTKAVQLAAKGDTITLREGEYAGGQTVRLADVTIRAYEGEKVVVKVPNDNERNGNCLWFTGNNGTVRSIDLEGGYYYVLKFELGVVGGLAEDCRIHGSGRDCVKIAGADKITLRRCEIFDSGLRDNSNAEGIDNVNGDEMLVQDCYIHDIATCGVYPKGGSIGSIIERCLIMRCNAAGISMAQASGLEFYDKQANPEYYSCRDCIARNNIIVDIKGSGIDLESALRPKVYNNTILDAGQTMRGGIRVAGNDKGGAAGLVKCKDIEIRNNIICVAEGSRRPNMMICKDSFEGTLTLSNNHYHKPGGKPIFWWEPTGAYGLDLNAWQKVSGETDCQEGDPGLDEAWHLKKDSPCIGKATPIKEFAEDYDNNKREKKWDTGADQTGGEALPTPPAAETRGTGASAEPPKPAKKTTGRGKD